MGIEKRFLVNVLLKAEMTGRSVAFAAKELLEDDYDLKSDEAKESYEDIYRAGRLAASKIRRIKHSNYLGG